MKIYYEAKALERAIDSAPRITPSTKSVLKKIIRSAPVADEVEKLRKERDAAVADIRGVMRNAADTCYRCKHRFGGLAGHHQNAGHAEVYARCHVCVQPVAHHGQIGLLQTCYI